MTDTQLCALYARYSDERQNPLSIDQQIGKCREYAERHSLLVLNDHIYADEAISGATDDRAGLRRLLHAALQKPRPFDVILVDDTSRMSRDLADSLEIVKKTKFAGVRMVFVSQGFDTSAPQMQTLVTVHGLVDSLYIEETRRRKPIAALSTARSTVSHTGGRVFGYRRVPIESRNSNETVTGEPSSRGKARSRFGRRRDDPANLRTVH